MSPAFSLRNNHTIYIIQKLHIKVNPKKYFFIFNDISVNIVIFGAALLFFK